MTLTTRHYLCMAALRVSLGMLLFWWGMARIISPQIGLSLQEKFYFNLFPSETVQLAFGYVEVVVGLLVMAGLYRKYAVPMQLAITGFSAVTILPALLDPFGFWLPIEKLSPTQHLFYPTVISLTAGILMYNMSVYDRYSLDYLSRSRRGIAPTPIAAE